MSAKSLRALACLKCRRFFRPLKTGANIEEGMPTDSSSTTWKSYKLWKCDIAICHGCGAQIAIGFGGPLSEHYMPDYEAVKERYPPVTRIDDCAGYKP